MQFIFEKENLLANRANSYYVSYMHEQITWAKKAIKSGELSTLYSLEEIYLPSGIVFMGVQVVSHN
jgi:hypothetical protein